MEHCLIIKGGKGSTLKQLYDSEVILGGSKVKLLGYRKQGSVYQVVQQLAKEQGHTGRFTIGVYDKATADILAQPSSRLMTSLQGINFQVMGRFEWDDRLRTEHWDEVVLYLSSLNILQAERTRRGLVWSINAADGNPIFRAYDTKRTLYKKTDEMVKEHLERKCAEKLAHAITWF